MTKENTMIYIEILSENFSEIVSKLKSFGCRFGKKTIDLGIGSGFNSVGDYCSGKNTVKFWYFDKNFIKTRYFKEILGLVEKEDIMLKDDPHGKYFNEEKIKLLINSIKERDEKIKLSQSKNKDVFDVFDIKK